MAGSSPKRETPGASTTSSPPSASAIRVRYTALFPTHVVVSSSGSSQHVTRLQRCGIDVDVAAGRQLRGRFVGGAARLAGAAASGEEPALHDAVGRVLHHGQHPQHRDAGRQEAVERGVDDVADRGCGRGP